MGGRWFKIGLLSHGMDTATVRVQTDMNPFSIGKPDEIRDVPNPKRSDVEHRSMFHLECETRRDGGRVDYSL
ncbi:hypothetical protein PSACC_00005 [Paramicrosporidium saccamoebae]|uniref:Uncharacterized protein n=1 Tax=Paramicrosporidium saccamoebae TaxID=1246581 RepID=A0A2H9TQX7_9FUNG|nr:hypothetical protein PSACC_00005 [Paramicrosporidium saccamoebae]